MDLRAQIERPLRMRTRFIQRDRAALSGVRRSLFGRLGRAASCPQAVLSS